MGKLARTSAAFAVLFLVAPAFAGDILVTTDGRPQGNPKASVPPATGDYAESAWDIVEENVDVIVYRMAGVPTAQSVPTSKIRAIFHDPNSIPPRLKQGMAQADKGEFEEARASFDACVAAAVPAWAKAEAAFRSADTYFQAGDAAEAEKALAAFRAAYPKSRWIAVAAEHRARSLMSLGKVEDARAEFNAIKRAPSADEGSSIEADYWLAWIDEQVAAGKSDAALFATALKGYEALVTRLSGKSQYESMLRLAQVGRASCLIATGKPQDAKDALTKLVTETKDGRALAGIYNKLGTATLRAAPAGDRAAMKEALFHYLRVIVKYGEEAGADDDAAEARYRAGGLFRDMKDVAPEYPARARREWNDCIAKYPGTVWAKRSQEALTGR